jgi:aspartate-semialdehyde dehydrogenase
MNIAIIGATGLVGRKMIEILEERDFPYENLTLLASKKSVGTKITVKNIEYFVQELTENSFENIDIALFSAGGETSKKFAPFAIQSNCLVIDNSSAWRMNNNVPLIIPEINSEEAFKHQGIIANPNCSTIQMLVPLKPLHDIFRIKRIVVSTYQSVTGSGKIAVDQLNKELNNEKVKNPAYPHKIAFNALPHIDNFLDTGYTKEEQKMIDETKKILNDSNVLVSPTTVRIPADGGHSESVNVEFEKSFEIQQVYELLENFPGITIQDNPEENFYPMPICSKDKDDIFVGRIRRDFTIENGLNMWIVSDNLRKGAATNAVQIAELFLNKGTK